MPSFLAIFVGVAIAMVSTPTECFATPDGTVDMQTLRSKATGYACSVCGHVYDPDKDGGGKAFEDLPDSWTCPVCGAPKSAYKPQVLADGTVVWLHDHDEHGADAAQEKVPAGIPTVTLNNGVVMPVVAAGTWQYSADTAAASVTQALSLGFRHIDTAHDCKFDCVAEKDALEFYHVAGCNTHSFFFAPPPPPPPPPPPSFLPSFQTAVMARQAIVKTTRIKKALEKHSKLHPSLALIYL